MSIVKPTPLAYVLDGKTTPTKKPSTPKIPAAPKKGKVVATSRNIFGTTTKKTNDKKKKRKTSALPKKLFIVCDDATMKPISVHRTKHGADVVYWKMISETDRKFIIMECESGKD
jgi:hypothetical protein